MWLLKYGSIKNLIVEKHKRDIKITFSVIKNIKKIKRRDFLKAHLHLLKLLKKYTNSIVKFLPLNTLICSNVIIQNK